jgi:hypothetical protein
MVPSQLEIPSRLRGLLDRDPAISGATKVALHRLTSWLGLSQLPFFPDFTDHGLAHISEVLSTCEQLVRPEVWDGSILTAEDAAALSVAVALHDLAMHLTPDGFRFLLTCNWRAPGFVSWRAAWYSFAHEASRWSGSDAARILGTSSLPSIPTLSDDVNDWTEAQRRLIGEFVRRHHAALAEVIALHGMPGSVEPQLLPEELTSVFCEVAGLIARSHGMSLRSAVAELSRRFGDVVAPARIHAPFIMAVLRVSDALQIHAGRAPALRLRMQALRSPLSMIEWAKHAAVIYTSVTRADPEEIYVFFRPESLSTYLGVRQLLVDLQGELDFSWAVIGEVYGRQMESGLDKLGLSVRRVRSNLDDPDLISALPFIPRPATLSVANGEVLALLGGPLYGDDPTFAIRELMQNAIDAVGARLARADAQPLHGQPSAPVVVELFNHGGEKSLRVTDAGIGMTEGVICDYLLRGGSTLSMLPPDGRPSLPRIGRFGIGALSYFLLADKFDILTRHVDAPLSRGICLQPSIADPVVEMRHCDAEIGTTILFRLSDEIYNQLKAKPEEWDWWCLRSPIVSRLIEGMELPQSQSAPGPEEQGRDDWFRLENSGEYRAIFWSLQGASTLIVNGIRVRRKFGGSWVLGAEIPTSTHTRRISYPMAGLWPLELVIPRISIFDGMRKVEFNLARTEPVRDSLPLSLVRGDMLKVIAQTFRRYAPGPPDLRIEDVFRSPHPALLSLHRHNYGRIAPWLVAGVGAAVFDIEALPALGIERLLVIAGSLSELTSSSSHIQELLRVMDRTAAVFVELDSESWFTHWVKGLAPVEVGPTRIAAARLVDWEFVRLLPWKGTSLEKAEQHDKKSSRSRRFLDFGAVEPGFQLGFSKHPTLFMAELHIEPSGQISRSCADPSWLAMTNEFVGHS